MLWQVSVASKHFSKSLSKANDHQALSDMSDVIFWHFINSDIDVRNVPEII